jgi:peptidoglycan-N-acetylglucosamine deacetylase
MSKHTLTTLAFFLLAALVAVAAHRLGASLWWTVLPLSAWMAVVAVNSSRISSNYHVRTFCGNPKIGENVVALTFDDGPTEVTPQVLDILKSHHAQATFFCIGKRVVAHPDLVQRLVAEGHTIGNHTFTHAHTFDFYRKPQVVAELEQTDAAITNIIGRRPVYFRPPNGVTNPSIRRALAATGHRVIGWNIRSMDGVNRDEGKVLANIKKRLQPGGVILMHDTSAHSVRVLEQLMVYLQERNYRVVPLEYLLNS